MMSQLAKAYEEVALIQLTGELPPTIKLRSNSSVDSVQTLDEICR